MVFTVFEDFSVFLSFPFKFHVPYMFVLFFLFRYVFLAAAGHCVKNGFWINLFFLSHSPELCTTLCPWIVFCLFSDFLSLIGGDSIALQREYEWYLQDSEISGSNFKNAFINKHPIYFRDLAILYVLSRKSRMFSVLGLNVSTLLLTPEHLYGSCSTYEVFSHDKELVD